MSKAYAKYKPSGVEWLGDVPEHWEVKKGRLIGLLQSTPNVSEEEQSEEAGKIDYIKVEDLNTEGNMPVFRQSRLKCIEMKKPFVRNALIFPKRGAAIFTNKVSILLHTGLLDPNMMGWQIDRKYELKYYYYALTFRRLDDLADTSTVPQINNKHIYPEFFPVPPLSEQQAIAAFLDRETGRIDALIAKKERLLELLAEQRTALISRAVTKGLDASVKLKPSGVEWLGDVPEHWKTLPVKRIVAIPVTDGPHETPEILDEGIPFVSAEAIRDNKIDFNRKRGFISESEHRRFCQKYHPKRDDIYMIKSGATTGNLAIVETDEEFSIWSPLAVIRVHKKKADARFILSAMNSKEFQTSVQLFWSFGTQQNIGMNVIENLPVPLPPLHEQQSIAAYLDRETVKIDTLSAKVITVIERLKEYRTALISSAVTGKIDVREAV